MSYKEQQPSTNAGHGCRVLASPPDCSSATNPKGSKISGSSPFNGMLAKSVPSQQSPH